MKFITIFVFCLVFGFLALWLLNQGILKSEKIECQKLLAQSTIYPLYQSASWQIEMCQAHDIKLSK